MRRQPGPRSCAYIGWTGIRAAGGEATPRRHSAKRGADRPFKSWHQISLPRIGELGQLELTVLLPLVFTANVVVATIVWFVVGSLLR